LKGGEFKFEAHPV